MLYIDYLIIALVSFAAGFIACGLAVYYGVRLACFLRQDKDTKNPFERTPTIEQESLDV